MAGSLINETCSWEILKDFPDFMKQFPENTVGTWFRYSLISTSAIFSHFYRKAHMLQSSNLIIDFNN